jgi:hypothetical protein
MMMMTMMTTMTMTTLFNFGSVRLCNSSCFHQAEVQSWLPIFLRHPVGPVCLWFYASRLGFLLPWNAIESKLSHRKIGWYWTANTSISDIGSFAGPLVPNPWSPHLIQPLGVLASICGVSMLPWEDPASGSGGTRSCWSFSLGLQEARGETPVTQISDLKISGTLELQPFDEEGLPMRLATELGLLVVCI